MTTGEIRLARNYGVDGNSWDAITFGENPIIEDINGAHNNKAMRTNPLTAKLLSTILFNGNILPGLIVDFGQWDETYTMTGYYTASNPTIDPLLECMTWFSQFRNWLITSQSDSLTRMYLQVGTTPEDDFQGSDGPDVALDPGNIPFGMTPHWGYRGIVIDLTDKYKSGQGVMQFTITFAVGFVLL